MRNGRYMSEDSDDLIVNKIVVNVMKQISSQLEQEFPITDHSSRNGEGKVDPELWDEAMKRGLGDRINSEVTMILDDIIRRSND